MLQFSCCNIFKMKLKLKIFFSKLFCNHMQHSLVIFDTSFMFRAGIFSSPVGSLCHTPGCSIGYYLLFFATVTLIFGLWSSFEITFFIGISFATCCNIIIIIDLFIEGSLISAQALFSLRALFGATRIHSFIRGWPL